MHISTRYLVNPKVKQNTNYSVIVLAANYYKSKTNGSRLLMNSGKKLRIFKQIEHLDKLNTEIIFVLGYDSEKIYDYVSKYKVVHNDNFDKCNSLKNVILGLRIASYNDIFIINGNNIYASHHFYNDGQPWVGTMPKCINVGVNVHDYVEHFNYGLDIGWSDIAFLNSECTDYLKQIKLTDKTTTMFDFEMYNKMIDNGFKFMSREVIYE